MTGVMNTGREGRAGLSRRLGGAVLFSTLTIGLTRERVYWDWGVAGGTKTRGLENDSATVKVGSASLSFYISSSVVGWFGRFVKGSGKRGD